MQNEGTAHWSRTFRTRVLLGLVLAATASAAAARGPLTLYADDRFRGAHQSFGHAVEDLRHTRFGNDRASSLELSRGCVAVLYRDSHFRGPAIEVRGPIDDLRRTALGNDRLSSFEVTCRSGRNRGTRRSSWDERDRWQARWRSGPSPSVAAVLYRHNGMRGNAVELEPGDAIANLRGTRVGNDALSSLEVARGCEVVLYADAGFRGATLVVDGSVTDLRRTAFGNDRASSVEVICH